MTVTYTAAVASSSIGCFLKLLFRWRGSLYKLLWREFLLFTIAYYTLSLLYRFVLNETARMVFERIAKYCQEFSNLIPLAFVLGFYVSVVVSRWWEQFNKIPWPDRMALFVTAHVHGHDDRARLMRRTMMRYLCLAFVITMHSISPGVKKRFPTFTHMTQAGFMLPNEQKVIEDIKTPHNKYFVPLVWVTSLVTRARKEQQIKDDFAVKTLTDEINAYRGCLGALFNFDWISIPLVYTQVVTWAAYTFFFSCLMGRQFVDAGKTEDVFIPVFTFLQFFFYMGWLKVAECMVNPFGDDDDDFDINSVIDRNLQVSYLIVDEMHSEVPELIKDQYWDDTEFELPYTVAAESYKNAPHLGSAMEISTSQKEQAFVIPPSVTVVGDNVEMTNLTNTRKIPQRSKQHLLPGDHSSYRVIRPMGIFHSFRRSQSHNPKPTDMMESPQIVSHRKRIRKNSETSQLTSEVPTPSMNANSEDIFQMSDLDGEDDVDQVAASSRSKVSFFNKIASLLKSKSQRSLDAGQKSKSSSHVQHGSVESTVTLTPNKGYVTVVSEGSHQTRDLSPVMSDAREATSISEEPDSSPTDETGPLLESMKSSHRGHISRTTEDETRRALDDLHKKQSSHRSEGLPRATTLLGQDVAHELGLGSLGSSETRAEPEQQSRSESVTYMSKHDPK